MAAARDWYEDQRPGLGDEFVADIEDMLELICSQPRLFPVKHRGVRRALIHRFPYAIFYQEDSKTVLVLAVEHQSRDPDRWKSRIP